MDNVVYTTRTLGEKWHCSIDTIEMMLRTGRLRGFRVGRRWRISEAAVLEHERSNGQVAS